jgi:hypothetical protein
LIHYEIYDHLCARTGAPPGTRPCLAERASILDLRACICAVAETVALDAELVPGPLLAPPPGLAELDDEGTSRDRATGGGFDNPRVLIAIDEVGARRPEVVAVTEDVGCRRPEEEVGGRALDLGAAKEGGWREAPGGGIDDLTLGLVLSLVVAIVGGCLRATTSTGVE